MQEFQIVMRRPDLNALPPPPPLPAGYTLRRAQAGDDAALTAALSSAFEEEWTVARLRQALLDAPDVPATFVVTSQGTPIATASARLLPARFPGSGYLHWVGVDAAHRGRRLGAVVTLAVLRYFQETGCRDAVLETERFRLPAIRTYLKLGFRPEPLNPAHVAVWDDVLARLDVPRD